MILYTYQIAHTRHVHARGIPAVDTTVKSGDPRLAPTWELVMGHKRGRIDDATYTRGFRQILDYWWFQDPLYFEDLFMHPCLALGCYCTPGAFCHRHLLVAFFQEVTHVDYRGEILPPSKGVNP